MKKWLLVIFWLPVLSRCIWRHVGGRFFVFRDESNEFLRFVWWMNSHSRGGAGEDVDDFYAKAREEIAARQRRGAWA